MIELLKDIKGRIGVTFETRPYRTQFMTVQLPFNHIGSDSRTVVVALQSSSAEDIQRGRVYYLDDITHIRVVE